MKVEIHPGHLSPQATIDQAEQLITELKVAGWSVELLVEGEALWDFDDWHDLNKFEIDFGAARDKLFPPYVWSVQFPVEDEDYGMGHWCGPVLNSSFNDYDVQAIEGNLPTWDFKEVIL